MVALGERASPSGQELLAEFIQYGHQRPFEEITRRYAGMVFNVCFRITKDKHEAEDAVQAVFLTLALQAKRGADIKALGPWLQQVAKRLSLDIRRSKKRRKNREERHHAEQTVRRESILDEALPSADLDELKTILHEELQKLPAKYRMPLILHYFGGLTRDEMAAELNCKPSTLGVRIFRGREMLAGRLSGRGIHISGAALATLLGYAVKRAVSDTLIASTSHAATAMMAGHDGAGYASAHVIGLTRRASSAVAFGKLKLTALTLLLAGTSLGAGAQALQLLPKLDVQRMLSNQLNKIIAPLFGSFSRPMLSQSGSPATPVANPSTANASGEFVPAVVMVSNAPSNKAAQTPAIVQPVAQPAAIASSEIAGKAASPDLVASKKYSPAVTSASSSANASISAAAIAADDGTDIASASSGAGGGSGGLSGGSSGRNTPLPPETASSSAMQSRYSNVILSSNDLIVGSSTGRGSTSVSTIAPTAVVLIPTTNNGTVTETNTGILRGWGTIQRTGVLEMNGEVIADGMGVARTLNLSDFSAIATGEINSTASSGPTTSNSPGSVSQTSSSKTSDPTGYSINAATSTAPTQTGTESTTSGAAIGGSSNSVAAESSTASTPPMTLGAVTPPTDGWYAVNRGRLCLGLEQSATDSSVFTWGDAPNSSVLTLTNSVRIKLNSDSAEAAGATDPSALQLSLLAPDRSDIPNLSEITGATIGIWQVDDSTTSGVGMIGDADLTICYDSLLANAFGATQNSVELWTFNAPDDTWSEVDPATFALDTVDHLVYGSAQDFSYFAVSAPPAPDANVLFVRANQLASISDPAGDSSQPPAGTQVVPEPTGLALLALGAGLLGRRRRSKR